MDNKIANLVEEGIRAQLSGEIEITPDKLLKEDLGMPSIKLVMFLTRITIQLDISIMDFTDYELLRLKTVKDIILLLDSKVNPN